MNIPSVSVITRTKDRPLLLERAINSVLNQTFEDWEHVIVNDGGDKNTINKLIDKYKTGYKNRLKLINIEKINHRWIAANIGLKKSNSEYIVLHDDDDSWETEFLAKTINYLDKNPDIGGVVTHLNYVIEKINFENEPAIEILDKYPFNTDIKEINLFKTVLKKEYPSPVSFVFRRDCLKKTGIFNEKLTKAADKEFHLRFLAEYDIDVICECLANYHARPYDNTNYLNCTFTGEEHKDNSYVENKVMTGLLRKDFAENKLGLGFIVNFLTAITPVIESGHIKNTLELCKGRRILLYGAGIKAEELISNFQNLFYDSNVIGFLDQDKNKQGKDFSGYKVFDPNEIKDLAPEIVLLTVANTTMVKPFVEKIIKENNLDCKILTID